MIEHRQKKSEVEEKSIISFVCEIIRQNKSTLIVKTASLLQSTLKTNKTGLQPVSRLVEQVHCLGGWVEGAKSLWCHVFAGRQTYGSFDNDAFPWVGGLGGTPHLLQVLCSTGKNHSNFF